MSDQWYYHQQGNACGPVTQAQLAALARAGSIGPGDFVWREGMAEWTTASGAGLVELPIGIPAPPPIISESRARPFPPSLPAPRCEASTRRPSSSLAWAFAIAAGGVALALAGVIGWMAHALTHPDKTTPRAVVAAAVDEPLPLPRTVESGPAPAAVRRQPSEANPALANGTLPGEPTAPKPETAQPSAVATPSAAAELAVATAGTTTSPPSAVATVASSPQADAKPELLYQEIDIRRAPKFSILGSVTVQDLEYQMLSELKASPPDTDGSRSIEQYVLETKLIKADDLSRPMFEQSLQALRGWHFQYKLIRGGEIGTWTAAPPAGRRTTRVEPPGGTGFLMTSVMDEDGWKEMAKLSFQKPDDATSGGGPWVRQMSHDFGALGSWYGETHFVRKGTSDGLLRVDYTHEMTYTPPGKDKAAGGLPFAITAADFKPEAAGGSYYFNAQENRVERLQERFLVRGAIQTEILGQAVTVEVEEDQMITVRIGKTNPWTK